MTTKLLLTGGRQRARAHFVREWNRYNEALVIELDLDSGLAKPWLRYETPSELTSPENPSIVFKSGCLVGDRLTLCTQTEILEVDVPHAKIVANSHARS